MPPRGMSISCGSANCTVRNKRPYCRTLNPYVGERRTGNGLSLPDLALLEKGSRDLTELPCGEKA